MRKIRNGIKGEIHRFRHPRDEREGRRQYWIAYTGCFMVLFLLVFIWYLAAGRTFIWANVSTYDGKVQHYTALRYYGKYLRLIVRSLLNGDGLVFPEWEFTLGEGSDILQTLHYYVIGDPLNLFSVFVPSDYTWVLYDILIVVRMYLAGIAFSIFCFENDRKSRFAILGGVSFTFSATGRFIMRRAILIS